MTALLLEVAIAIEPGPDDATRWAMVLLAALGLFALAFMVGFCIGEWRRGK